jgi:hypothetical protein
MAPVFPSARWPRYCVASPAARLRASTSFVVEGANHAGACGWWWMSNMTDSVASPPTWRSAASLTTACVSHPNAAFQPLRSVATTGRTSIVRRSADRPVPDVFEAVLVVVEILRRLDQRYPQVAK